jgi:hypothetical protein
MRFLQSIITAFSKTSNQPTLAAGAPKQATRADAEPEEAGSTATVASLRSVRYPPHDPGLPLQAVKQLVAGQEEIINRLRLHAALPAKFESRFLQPVERVARHISSLPASREGLFAGPGGLFRACVELAFASYQAADGRIFSVKAGVEERHTMEVRWRYACFVSGLLWPLGTTLERLKVINGTGDQWAARITPLLDWEDAGASVYCAWPKEDVVVGPSPTGAALAMSIMGDANMQWLEDASPVLLSSILGIAAGNQDVRYQTAFEVVSTLWERIKRIERDRRPEAYGRLQYGSHLGPHLLDAMSRLLMSGKWRINDAKCGVYADTTGLYLHWPDTAADITRSAAELGLAGLPSSPAGLLSALTDADLIDANGNDVLHEIADDDGAICSAVRLRHPASLIPDFSVSAYATQRKVLLSAIKAADPLTTKAEENKPAAVPKKPAVAQAPIAPPAPGPDPFADQNDLPLQDESESGKDQTTVLGFLHELPAERMRPELDVTKDAPAQNKETPRPAKKDGTVKAAADKETAKTEAAQEVSYYELIPVSYRSQIKRKEGEILGRIVEMWKEHAPNKDLMGHEQGCAIAMDVLKTFTSNPPDVLLALSKAGLLYCHPSTPGKLVHEITPEGGKKRPYFVLSDFAAKAFGMRHA